MDLSRLGGAALSLVCAVALTGVAAAAPFDAARTASEAPALAGAPDTAPVVAAPDTIIAVSSSSASAAARAMALSTTLRDAGEEWIGIPYRWGGTTRRGIDCSAFVQQYVRKSLGIELPRTTATQVHRGTRISKGELQPGDLVFFRRRGVRHVGVYLGDGDFIHASSSRGVTVSSLSSSYYTRHYWTARRILTAENAPQTSPAAGPTRRADAEGARLRSRPTRRRAAAPDTSGIPIR